MRPKVHGSMDKIPLHHGQRIMGHNTPHPNNNNVDKSPPNKILKNKRFILTKIATKTDKYILLVLLKSTT